MRNSSILNSTVLTTYLFILSICYLWGFWSHFEINILQFINLSDILKAVIIPMITTVIAYLIQVAINHFNSPKSDEVRDFKSAHICIKSIIILQYLFIIFISIAFLGSIIFLLCSDNELKKRIGIGFILSTVIFFFIPEKEKILKMLPGTNKLLFFGIMCYLPPIFFSNGVHNGEQILNGKNSFLVESNSKCTSDNSTKYRYIDTLSDKVFAMSIADNSICIFKYDYIKLSRESNLSVKRQ